MQVLVTKELEAACQPRRALPLPYLVILIVELVALMSLASTTTVGRPPLSYEFGWAGSASMLLMQAYSLRRRLRILHSAGSLRAWLDAHIFLGLQGLLFIGYHSVGVSLRPTLAALNVALLGVIVLSGLTGRYLYSLIWAMQTASARAQEDLTRPLGGLAAGLTPPRRCRGLVDLLRLDFARRHTLRRLRRDPQHTPLQLQAAGRAASLSLRQSALEVIERWLAGWTLLHRPLAFLLLAVTTLHVLAHFAYAA